MALCGFPFISGFYSKDIILELFFLTKINIFIFLIVFAATILTLTYSVRLTFYMFFNNIGSRRLLNLSEEIGMLVPIRILTGFSLAAGGLIRI